METLFAQLLEWMQAHPNWAGFIVLIVSALESFLVVGLFVPGTVVMFGIGAMVAAGGMPLYPTLIWAAVGAVLGDGASYLIGRYYHQQLRVIWPFRKYPMMISRGVDFFHRHGGKSVVLARFVGPVRPLLPAVAGMLNMPPSRFFAVNTLSAILWAPAYILPGMLFGASLGIAAEIAGRLALLLIILLALLWFSWWLVRRIARSFQPHAESVQMRILEWSRKHPAIEPMTAALLDPEHPEARGMSVLSGLLLIASWALFVIPRHITSGNLLSNVDLYLFNALQSLRSPLGDRLMVMVTELGDGEVLYGFTLLLSLWLVWRRDWRMALHWVITVTAVALLTWTLKLYTVVERPPLLDTSIIGYSFPSMHASLSVAVFGFLAVAIARELRSNWHWIPYSIAVFLVVSISFSRLYLGAHWLSDILAGWSLGLMWVATMGIAYRHHPAPAISTRAITPVALLILFAVASFHNARSLQQDLAFYQPSQPEPVALSRNDWLENRWQDLPAFRDDLEGRHHHPLTVQWMGSLEQLRSTLEAHDWKAPSNAGVVHLMDLFNSEVSLDDMPILPQLHRGQTQRLLLTRQLPGDPHILTLRLWESRYFNPQENTPLWIGSASSLRLEDRFWLLRFLRTDDDFNTPLQQLATDLGELDVRHVQRRLGREEAADVDWDGTVLLISPRPVSE
ncbi:MAG TPA: phosphatase PAP2 family protein [Gammaproteobacteria bacterium]|nr:phosphatase PAP2 family protein [Gammaproteobacteria bacterium]